MIDPLGDRVGASGVVVDGPVVSVIVLTYNHERYIEQALRSILGQLDAPAMEVFVADDCSTDRTPQILDVLLKEFPDRFRRLPRPANLGLSRNLESAWKECRGRYVAILEGDDCWTDRLKLARVVAALDAHPKWSGCFHAVLVERDGRESPGEILTTPPRTTVVSLPELLCANCVTTLSSMTYRRGLITSFPAWHRYLINGDYALHLLHCEQGSLGYLPEPMTLYRVHSRGLWSSLDRARRWQQYLSLLAYLELHFDGLHADAIARARQIFFDDYASLVKIESRYRTLGLDRLAALLKWGKTWFHGAPHATSTEGPRSLDR